MFSFSPVELDANFFQTMLEATKPPTEIWFRDVKEADLWHGPNGLMVNTAALLERKNTYQIVMQDPLRL